MLKPYIGVTGPSTLIEVEKVCNEFSNAGFTKDSSHIPMLGFLVSHKTLEGKEVENLRYTIFELL